MAEDSDGFGILNGKHSVSTCIEKPQSECLLQKVRYGITSCLGANRTDRIDWRATSWSSTLNICRHFLVFPETLKAYRCCRNGEEEQAQSDDSDGEGLGNVMYGRQQSKWLPRSLELLFGDQKEVDVDEQLRRVRWREAYTEEARLMELLADEEADEDRVPDDGELEGSGDDFNGWVGLSKLDIFSRSLNNPLDITLN